MNNGHTADSFRTWSANHSQLGYDVGVLLPYQVYNRTAYDPDESEIYFCNRDTCKADRSAKANAVRFESIRIECPDTCQLYN